MKAPKLAHSLARCGLSQLSTPRSSQRLAPQPPCLYVLWRRIQWLRHGGLWLIIYRSPSIGGLITGTNRPPHSHNVFPFHARWPRGAHTHNLVQSMVSRTAKVDDKRVIQNAVVTCTRLHAAFSCFIAFSGCTGSNTSTTCHRVVLWCDRRRPPVDTLLNILRS